MKKIALISFILLSSGFYTFSFSQEAKGKVTIIRPRIAIWIDVRFKVFIDKKIVCKKLHPHKYLVYELDPGTHKFALQQSADGFKEEIVKYALNQTREIDVEAGKNYYLIVFIDAAEENFYFQQILGNSYKNLLKDTEEETECE
ncbi:MAG: hypothetical protein NTU98_02895 [Bacteroidetes bacterium]|nr:hypothetical protein [Bacteroidota bacterium]